MGNCLQVASYPIKPSPKTTHFHIFLWLVTSCSSTDSDWTEDDAKFGKIKCAPYFSPQSLQPHGGVAIPLCCGRHHLNEWHPAQFNGVPMVNVNEASQWQSTCKINSATQALGPWIHLLGGEGLCRIELSYSRTFAFSLIVFGSGKSDARQGV